MANIQEVLEEWSVKDLEDGSSSNIREISCTEMGNHSKPVLQVCFLDSIVNYKLLATERWAYQASNADARAYPIEAQSWTYSKDQYVKNYLVTGAPLKARVEIKTRSWTPEKRVTISMIAWMIIQAIFFLIGFYQNPNSMPARFVLFFGPVIIFCILLLVTKWGKIFIDTLDLKTLTVIHSIRIPVEITLFFVFSAGLLSVLMTFEGKNFDVVSGITAPLIFYLVFIIKKTKQDYTIALEFMASRILV